MCVGDNGIFPYLKFACRIFILKGLSCSKYIWVNIRSILFQQKLAPDFFLMEWSQLFVVYVYYYRIVEE